MTDQYKKAYDYHKEGFNCAESIFLAFRERVAPEVSVDAVRMATPFGGGMGYAGCLCGALAGSVMVLGLLKGRSSADVPRKESYELSAGFHNIFREKFGATCCRVLNKNRFGSAEQAVTCGSIINGTEELLESFLSKNCLA